MGVVVLKTGSSRTLTRYLNEGNWAAVLEAVQAGAPAHTKMADSPLTLFEGVLRAMAAYMRAPLSSKDDHRRETEAQMALFRALAQSPADLDLRRPTPLSAASLMGRRDLVDLLLEAGHDPSAVGEGVNPCTAVAQVYLPKQAGLALLAARGEQGWDDLTGLDRRNCLKRLARAGLDLGAPAFRGTTALHLACAAKDTPLVLFLLAQGVPATAGTGREAAGWMAWSPLEISIVVKNENAVAALLEAGACPLQGSHLLPGSSLLVLMGQQGLSGMLSAVLRKGLEGPADELEKTLHAACRHGNDEVMVWFQRRGFDCSSSAPVPSSNVVPFPGRFSLPH